MRMRPEPVTDLDWTPERARDFGEEAVELWAEFLDRLRDLPVGRRQSVAGVRAAVARPIPDAPASPEEVFSYLRELLFEHSTLPGHPGFMAFISGAGTA